MTAVSIKSNGREVVEMLDSASARILDLTVPMSIGAEKLYKLMSDAMRASASPDGSAWLPLKQSTLNGRKRGRKGKHKYSGPLRPGQMRRTLGANHKPLRGDSAQLWGTSYATANRSEIWFGSKAKSKGGFFYWLSQQFGAKNAGRSKTTTIPQRAWMPVTIEGDQLTRMYGGKADKFFEDLFKLITKYITTGKAR